MLPEEVKKRILKDQLTQLANSLPSDCSETLRQRFEQIAVEHISRYIQDKGKKKSFLLFYQQQIKIQTKPFNPRYLENLPKI